MKPTVIEGKYSTPDNPVKRISPQAQFERKARRIVNGLAAVALLGVDAVLVNARVAKEPESLVYYGAIGLLAAAVIIACGIAATRGEAE